MTSIADLLDRARRVSGLASDNALAQRLGTNRQVVSQWRHGDSYPSEDNIATLAQMAREDAGEWLVRVRAQRTEGEARRAWEDVVRRLGVAATVALCAIALPYLADSQRIAFASLHLMSLAAVVAAIVGTELVRHRRPFFGADHAEGSNTGRCSRPGAAMA